MKIGVISDTHGDYASWERAFNYLRDADLIMHAGDVLYHGPRNEIPSGYNPKKLIGALNDCSIPILISRGNCDASVDQMVLNIPIQSSYVFAVVENKRFLVQHGDQITESGIQDLISRYKLDYFITGHTHVPVLRKLDNCIIINPGSTSLSKRDDKLNTIGIIEDNDVYIIDLETGDKLFEIKK
ncbi:MAG: uncharacterized protein PWR08_611 [Thermoanaerobacterium sp.]|uniref:phosphodiesterase n=1 Tax=Thermoanaerobacterium sp. CMT5567-10 TaxID=3061989 RepID=UPI00265492E1|nr:phosphodiesterase [Thermoanaerobacterium sp. CMT5567-10]MDN5316487.1 uncharacterized protein [Thermoanaerobacterium sp.]WKV09723.1 phosphodiesterase [Thermoanaerobacterium sp. CMT5567-10]